MSDYCESLMGNTVAQVTVVRITDSKSPMKVLCILIYFLYIKYNCSPVKKLKTFNISTLIKVIYWKTKLSTSDSDQTLLVASNFLQFPHVLLLELKPPLVLIVFLLVSLLLCPNLFAVFLPDRTPLDVFHDLCLDLFVEVHELEPYLGQVLQKWVCVLTAKFFCWKIDDLTQLSMNFGFVATELFL